MFNSGAHGFKLREICRGITGNSLLADVTAAAGRGSWSAVLRASQRTFRDRSQELSLQPAIWFYHPAGLIFQGSWKVHRQLGPMVLRDEHHRVRVAAGWSFPRVRFLAFTEGDKVERISGAEGLIALWDQSVAFQVGWDAKRRGVVGSLSVQLSSSFGSLFAQAWRDTEGISHSLRMQGSAQFSQGMRLAPYMNQESSVELRIFEDRNGNGIQEAMEPILPHIDAQLYQGGWSRLKTGGAVCRIPAAVSAVSGALIGSLHSGSAALSGYWNGV